MLKSLRTSSLLAVDSVSTSVRSGSSLHLAVALPFLALPVPCDSYPHPQDKHLLRYEHFFLIPFEVRRSLRDQVVECLTTCASVRSF